MAIYKHFEKNNTSSLKHLLQTLKVTGKMGALKLLGKNDGTPGILVTLSMANALKGVFLSQEQLASSTEC